MKIAVLGHRRFPIKEPFAGGLEHFTHTLVRGLQQRGCEVTLFAHPNSDRTLPLAKQPIFDTSFCKTYEEESHEAYLNIMDYLNEGDFDLIHDNSLNYFPLILEDSIEAPLVTTLHTPPFPRLLSAVRYQQRRNRGRYISISQYNSKLWGLEGKEIEIIHNGVDTKIFSCNGSSVNNYALWTGRIIPEKGTHLAIAAAQKAGIDLIIAGPQSDRIYWEKQIAPHLGKGVVYAGHLTKTELVMLLNSAAMTLCTPVWTEPFGLVVIESLACGTPVVAFNRGAMSEILTSETGILVTPEDTDAMAKGIKQAFSLSRDACRKLAVENFSLDTMLNRYVRAYEVIIHQFKRKSLINQRSYQDRQSRRQKICTSDTTYTFTVADTPKEPEPLLDTLQSQLHLSVQELANKTGKE